jgi:hypothetical protein
MGLLSFLKSNRVGEPAVLPKGSFTIDKTGRLLSSTLASSVHGELIREVGDVVLQTFRGARDAHLNITEFTLNFSGLKLTARELRGGAIVFVSPREFGKT